MMASSSSGELRSATVASDAVQLAGDCLDDADSILHTVGDETPLTFEECREVLERMAGDTRDLKLHSYVANIRTMEDIAKRPSRDVLRVIAFYLKVSQKVSGKNLPAEQLHSNVQTAFNEFVREQRRSQLAGVPATQVVVRYDSCSESAPKQRKTRQASTVGERRADGSVSRQPPPKKRKLLTNSDAQQLTVAGCTAPSIAAGVGTESLAEDASNLDFEKRQGREP